MDEAYPDVPVVRLVLDNLNTHRMASLYETFPAPEARRIARRLEFHYTPKHGIWAQHGGDRVQRAGPGLSAEARKAARRFSWERRARSLLSCVSSSHRSNSSGPNRSRGSISRTTR